MADDRIDYSVTVTDPETYTAPFTIAFPITPQPDYKVLPYECHEGNMALANILSAAKACCFSRPPHLRNRLRPAITPPHSPAGEETTPATKRGSDSRRDTNA